jgi:hypothetical protein
MAIVLFLVLEDESCKTYHLFNDTEGFEEFFKTINLNDYIYKNIYFEIDGELNMGLSKLYNKRYLGEIKK